MSIKTPKHCSLDAQDNYLFSETTVKAETTSVLSYIKSIEKRFSDDDVMVVCGYEAGSTGFSFCRELQKKNISCVVMAPSSLPKSPDDKKWKWQVVFPIRWKDVFPFTGKKNYLSLLCDIR